MHPERVGLEPNCQRADVPGVRYGSIPAKVDGVWGSATNVGFPATSQRQLLAQDSDSVLSKTGMIVIGSSKELIMTTAQSRTRVSWNQGRIVGPKPPLKPKHIWAIRTRLQHDGRIRDLAMFNTAIDSKLPGCDVVKLRVFDVHLGDSVRLRTTVVQQKTGRPVPFELTDPTRDALAAWLKKRGLRSGDWLFPSRSHVGDHVTTRQYSRLADEWVALAGLDPAAYGTHSLRRTKVALVYKRTGNLRACQLLLGHSKLESTVRYLGIEVDDALVLSEQTDL